MAYDVSQRGDKELLAACLEGDSAAWEALIGRYQRLIYSIPIKIGLSPNDAADVFQSVCVKLLEGLPNLRHRDRISSWLTVTTRRESWRVAALRHREHVALPLEWGDGTDAVIDIASTSPLVDELQQAVEQQQAVRAAVASLPDRCRELITLLFYGEGELSYVEIARRLNMPRDSMGPTRARCLAKLKKLLEGKI